MEYTCSKWYTNAKYIFQMIYQYKEMFHIEAPMQGIEGEGWKLKMLIDIVIHQSNSHFWWGESSRCIIVLVHQ